MYAQYKLLQKGRRKKDFNIEHGRYGAGKRKRNPRDTKSEFLAWESQTKRDKYWKGRKQRKDLKGLTRAGRLAYFKKLREKWSEDELAAWKENWKRKTAKWNKPRQPKPKEDGVEEEKETEPVREKKSL